MQAAPTFGWDIVYAVRLPQVNARIAEKEHAPRQLLKEIDGVTVSALIGDWRIVPGGSGHLIFVALTLTQGWIKGEGIAYTPFSGSVTLAIELYALHEIDGKRAALKVQQPDRSRDEDAPLFAIQRLTLTGIRDVVAKGMVRLAIQEWLEEHPGVIEHIFAVVDIGEALEGHPFAWLQPTEVSYAFGDAARPEECVLAVLAMVLQRSSEGLDQHVSAAAVPADSGAAILISPHLLLDNIIREALPLAFQGTKAGDFEMSADFPEIYLAKECVLPPLKVDGHRYRHVLTALRVRFQSTELICESENYLQVGDGVKVFTSTRTVHGLKVVEDANGKATFTFVTLGEPENKHRTEIDPEIVKRDERIGDIVLLVGLVLSLVTAGTLSLIITIASAVLSGVISNRSYIQSALAPAAPSMDLLAFNAATPCVWSGHRVFHASSVDLVESLRLRGELRLLQAAT